MSKQLTPKDLRTKRLERGWTRQQLAERCGIELRRLVGFEEGEILIDCEDDLLAALESDPEPES